jgi:hypothetical protein
MPDRTAESRCASTPGASASGAGIDESGRQRSATETRLDAKTDATYGQLADVIGVRLDPDDTDSCHLHRNFRPRSGRVGVTACYSAFRCG